MAGGRDSLRQQLAIANGRTDRTERRLDEIAGSLSEFSKADPQAKLLPVQMRRSGPAARSCGSRLPSRPPRRLLAGALASLREKLIKIGAKVVAPGGYVTFQMAEVAVSRRMFADILSLITRPRAVARVAFGEV